MISLARFLSGMTQTWPNAMVSLFQAFFEIVSAGAVNYDQQRYDQFRAELSSFPHRITIDTEPENIAIVAEMFSKLMDENKRGVERVLREQSNELKSLVKLTTRAVAVLGVEETGSIEKIRVLNREIDDIQTVKDIAEFKSRLKKSLDEMQQSVELRRKNSLAAVTELKRELDESKARLTEFRVEPNKDAVTGLPTKEDATNLLSDLSGRDAMGFLVLLNVQQLPALNVKYGYEIGNVILQDYRDQTLVRMASRGRLFRWGGKCFLAVFAKTDLSKEEGGDMVRSLRTIVTLQIDTGTRTAMIPISPKLLCLGRTDNVAGAQLIERIEEFAADL